MAPIKNTVLNMYESNTVIIKGMGLFSWYIFVAHKLSSVILKKMDLNRFVQSKVDEMTKKKVSNHTCDYLIY